MSGAQLPSKKKHVGIKTELRSCRGLITTCQSEIDTVQPLKMEGVMPEMRWFVVAYDWPESGSEPAIECEDRDHAAAVLAFSKVGCSASEMVCVSSVWREKACKYHATTAWVARNGGDGRAVSSAFLRYLGLI